MNNTTEIHSAEERLDDLIVDNMRILQRPDQFCFSIDAVILAHFPSLKKKDKYADLGTGTGAIPLLMSAFGAGHITAFEINPVLADLAKRSVALNEMEDRITVCEADYRTLPKTAYGTFDGVVSNPPYFKSGTGEMSQRESFAIALHEAETTMAEVAESARKLLRYGGKFWLIYSTSNVLYCLQMLQKENLEPKRLRFVHSNKNTASKVFLTEAMFGGKPGLVTEPPLYIYNEDGTYSEEVQSWYTKG